MDSINSNDRVKERIEAAVAKKGIIFRTDASEWVENRWCLFRLGSGTHSFALRGGLRNCIECDQ